MQSGKRSGLRVAQNLINTYGMQRFVYLISLFKNNESGQKIASEFGVTRQRVNQWKARLGTEHRVFVLDREIESLFSPPTFGRKSV